MIEPWRATAFPVIKDLMVDRSAFDRIIEAGGFITAPTGGAPDANLIPIAKPVADAAMDAAECIGCGACVAACPNGAANLFTGAKITHLNLLPQGQAERYGRVEAMVDTMESFFGSCTNHGECEAACPKSISIDVIALDEHRLPQVEVQEPQAHRPDLMVGLRADLTCLAGSLARRAARCGPVPSLPWTQASARRAVRPGRGRCRLDSDRSGRAARRCAT